MTSLAEIRKMQHEYRQRLGASDDVESWGYINNWKKSPYSCSKAWLYQECGALLAYLLQYTPINPNTITVLYGLAGLAAGALLVVGTKAAVITSVFILFFKSVLDWSDGLLARIKGKTSITGDILDWYGGSLGAWVLPIGLGFYVAQKSGMLFYYYLIPLFPLLAMGKLHSYAFYVLYKKYITAEKLKQYNSNPSLQGDPGEASGSALRKIYERLERYIGHRAHTVDFICLVLLVETFTQVFVSWIIFLAFVAKEFVTFTASFYFAAKSGWAEKELNKKLKDLSGDFAVSEAQQVPAPKE
jgi:phosphatidylglycerophosphate synthase